nr:T9SS type A sorting domain-containing protein [Bacteroidia bacterium]
PAVAGATSYTWTAPGGATLNSPNGSNSIDVLYPANYTNGNLCVTANNGCGSSTPRCVAVKGTPSNPGAISGPAVVCANESGDNYSVGAVYGATSYTWSTPSGTSIISGQGTASIILDWGSNGGVIGVTAIGSCGNSGTRTLNVAMTCKISGSTMPGTEVSAYPNPVSNMLNVDVNSLTSGVYTLELMDLSGRVVYSSTMNTVEGMNSNQVDVSSYSKGMYMLSVKNSEGFAKQIRIAVE